MWMVPSLRLFAEGLLSLSIPVVHFLYRKFPIFHAAGRLTADRKLPRGLNPLPASEAPSQRVVRVSGLNPGTHTLQGTNTYLIGTGDERMLVDTGEDITAAKYVPHLLRAMSEAGCKRISKILLTHGHGDHQGGVAALTAVLQAKGSQPTPSIHKRTWLVNGRAGEDFPARGFRCVDILDGEEFACEGATLRAIYTPGHTNDHVAFWLLEDGALLTGDCILGCGTTVFDDLSTYMSSLHRLKEVVEKSNIDTQAPPITRIYPGHGPVVNDALAKVDEYLQHRLEREEGILAALEQRKTLAQPWITSWQLVSVVYGTIPLFVKVSAQCNLLHHLDKLHKQGAAKVVWPDLWVSPRLGKHNDIEPHLWDQKQK